MALQRDVKERTTLRAEEGVGDGDRDGEIEGEGEGDGGTKE